MDVRAVLFDLDGTLLDTLADIAACTNASLAELGCPAHPVDAYRLLVGEGRESLARRALPPNRRDNATVARAVEGIDREYKIHWADRTLPYPGIAELLSDLACQGVRMAVLSNKREDFTRASVARLLPGMAFEVVAGARPSVPLKPDPTAALEIARSMGIPEESFVFLGDTGADMQTAIGAGMYPAGALWGFRDAEELLGAGARTLLAKPAELLNLLR